MFPTNSDLPYALREQAFNLWLRVINRVNFYSHL